MPYFMWGGPWNFVLGTGGPWRQILKTITFNIILAKRQGCHILCGGVPGILYWAQGGLGGKKVENRCVTWSWWALEMC